MRINNLGIELRRSELARGVQGTGETGKKQEAAPVAAPTRGDSVQISDAGRALAAQQAGESTRGALTPERVAEIRQRILEGAYNSVEVVDQVARRLLEQGDI